MASKINLIDLYAFYNAFDADVLETLMAGSHISCRIKNCSATSHGNGEHAEMRIAVEHGMVEDAKRIISDAIRCGVISAVGKFKA
ncbi:MAG: hypothetical protein HY894_06240 [Deltaproteobacteria bacterium]|nr:hypothetical protein [Deltaproteobacteria bacterium]